MAILALLWLPILVIPLAVDLHGVTADAFDAIDYTVWALFAIEYLTKVYLAQHRAVFVRQHLIDLLVIAVPLFRPLRAARLLRFLRLIRVGAVLVNSLSRIRTVLTHRGLHFVLLTVVLTVFAGAGVELGFEHHLKGSNIHTYTDAIWWAVVTVTTVGYGDRYPVSAGGRGVAVVLMLVGIGLIGVLTASVASYFIGQQDDNNERRLTALEGQLDRIEALLHEISGRPKGNGGGNAEGELISPAESESSI